LGSEGDLGGLLPHDSPRWLGAGASSLG